MASGGWSAANAPHHIRIHQKKTPSFCPPHFLSPGHRDGDEDFFACTFGKIVRKHYPLKKKSKQIDEKKITKLTQSARKAEGFVQVSRRSGKKNQRRAATKMTEAHSSHQRPNFSTSLKRRKHNKKISSNFSTSQGPRSRKCPHLVKVFFVLTT